MRLPIVLAVLTGILVLACSSIAPAPAEPTSNIDATVEVRLKEERASQPTSIPSPTNTLPPKPASTVVPQPTNTPTPILQPMVRGQKDSAIEVTVYNAEKVWPGTTLLSDHHDVGSPRVSHDADRLANGNTLYAFGYNDGLEDAQAKEVTPDGELVWQWYAKDYFNKEPYVNLSRNGWTHTNAVERLENGNTLISPRNFDLLVEVDSEGSLVRTLGDGMLVDAHDPEFLSTGNILVSNQVRPHEALEFDPDTNKIVWRFVPPYPQIANSFSVSLADAKPVMMPIRDVDRLPNGNVLITGYPFIIEVTRDGEIVWQLQYADMESVVEGRSGSNKGPSYGFYKAQRISVTEN